MFVRHITIDTCYCLRVTEHFIYYLSEDNSMQDVNNSMRLEVYCA